MFGALHLTFSRPIFIQGLLLIIYPALLGRGKFTFKLCGHHVFNHMGKLTYGMSIIHIPVMSLIFAVGLQGEVYTFPVVIKLFIITLVATYVLSFVATVVYESPVMMLVREYIGPHRKIEAKTKGPDDDGASKKDK